MAGTSLTIPTTVSPELLAKIRQATDAVAPGKKGKLVLSLDNYGNLVASIGAKVGTHVTIGSFATRSASGTVEAGAQATIEWEPAP